MSLGGDRGHRLWTADALVLFCVLLLTLPSIPVGNAQSVSDPWWGPTSKDHPTDGWAVRIPITVTNDLGYAITDPVITVDLDFNALLVKAGWTNETRGDTARLRGFTLDPDSIRVVEYGRGFGPGPKDGSGTKPLAAQFYKTPFGTSRIGDFDPAFNPSGTVAFVAPGTINLKEQRWFYVYANPVEFEANGAPAAPKLDLAARAPLDAYLWGSVGTTAYGYEPDQTGTSHEIQVKALDFVDGKHNRVTLYTNTLGGKFTLAPSTPAFRNPADLDSNTASTRFFVPAGTPFKIVAEAPIAVAGAGGINPTQGNVAEQWGYVPSRTGSFAGNDFDVYGYAVTAGTQPTVTVIRAGAGSFAVGWSSDTFCPTAGRPGAQFLSAASPMAQLPVCPNSWVHLTGNGNFLVSLDNPRVVPDTATPIHTTTLPALTGGPAGLDFYAHIPADGGFLRYCAQQNTTLRIKDFDRQSLQIYPEGVADTAPNAPVRPGCRDFRPFPSTPPDTEWVVADYDRDPSQGDRVPVTVIEGATVRGQTANERPAIGAFGGPGATDIQTIGRIGVFGVYNDTKLSFRVEHASNGVFFNTTTNLSVAADGFRPFDPAALASDATGRVEVLASKPVIVTSIERFDHPYVRYVAGVPAQPQVDIGPLDFRGPLVELKSPDTDGRSLTRTTGPGTTVACEPPAPGERASCKIDVINLGRWVAGDGLPDTYDIACVAPQGWSVDGCKGAISLNSGDATRLKIAITPDNSTVDPKRPPFPVVVSATSRASGVSAKFTFNVHVDINYDVGMWFDVENGRRTIDPPFGLDPGASHTYSILLKNTGSNADTFDLTVDAAKAGWTQSRLPMLAGEEVDSVSLQGGESRTLSFTVTAPNAETAPQNIVSITAVSRGDPAKIAQVETATRIRPKVSIHLSVDPQTQVTPPGEPALFNLTATNDGNDLFDVVFRLDSILPSGWNATLPLSDVIVNKGENTTLVLTVLPPPDARAGDLATVKVAADVAESSTSVIPGDEVAAVVVVRRVHDIAGLPGRDAEGRPGETLRYDEFLVQNRGNGNDVLELLPNAVNPAWDLTTDNESLFLGYNLSEKLPLVLKIPKGTPEGAYNVTFAVRLSREAVQNLSLPVHVARVGRVTLTGPAAVRTSPGRPTTLDLGLENVGNVEGDFAFASAAPAGWNVTFTPSVIHLAPGDTARARATLNASRDAADGAYSLALSSRLGEDEAAALPVAVSLARPLLSLEGVQSSGRPSNGELVLVTASITNRGGIDAQNVTVALLVDGRPVDSVVLARVPVNSTQLATLNWVSTSSSKDVRVVLDPANEIVQAEGGKSSQDVAFASKLPVPAPSIGLLSLSVVALAVLARRLKR